MDENMDDLSVGVLAGGKSSRMGRDKVFLKIGEKTFIEHICEELSCFGELLISCRDPEKFSALGYATVTDERDGFGPLEGIRQLIRHAACDDIFICAVDMPFISKELVEFLWKKKDPGSDCIAVVCHENDNVSTTEDGINPVKPGSDEPVCRVSGRSAEPLCAIYNKRVLSVIESMVEQGKGKVRDLFDNISLQTVLLDEGGFQERVIVNLNTYDEYMSLTEQ
ncbi:MAG: molybdenum cofactor guanylyltransferase [Eubacterium sp.]|nr:molybdenum cofactor guanylyltransferase [Eubacterium sp.]MBR0118605.1 molybdenum cofactor guanylyltransferase [Eubacterium sp.]